MASEIISDSDFYAFRTIEIVTEAVKNYADKARSVLPVVKVYLFGSWVLGTAKKYSDVDVCFF
jgi:predicted nucleotidyltransferase